MTAEISLKADKEDKMLTVQCSLVSDSLFSMDKFMQADVQCKFGVSIQFSVFTSKATNVIKH